MNNFVHLHVHSEYSMLDGLGRVGDLVTRAAQLNQPAIALTDHGAMYGTIPFYKAAKSAGIKPIIGMEGYLARRTMQDREGEDRKSFHTLLLAQNQIGLGNLFKLASLAQLEGFYYKPRIDRDTLFAHNEGIITTTGCLAGEIPQAILGGDFSLAEKLMGMYLDVFGRDRFFVEIQDHNIPELDQINPHLLALGKKFNVRLLATNDVHYTNPGDGKAHDLLLCVQTKSLLTAPDRMRMSGDMDYYLQDAAEMAAKFGHLDGALSNTLLVAEMCDVNLDSQGYHLPEFPTPDGKTAESYLRELCVAGIVRKYDADALLENSPVRNRMEHELNIIHKMGFDGYFLIVWDICRYAAENDMWWNVRGSGAGSIVAYALNITDVDPISQGLVFERFLNPHRVSMPDIDIDFPDDDRHRIATYIQSKYGREKVAQIITFGTMGARSAIRDVGRAQGIDLSFVNQIAAQIPDGKPQIEWVLHPDSPIHNPALLDLYRTDIYAKSLLDGAMALEGMNRHASTHAAGIIIADRPLEEYVPLNRPTSDKGLGEIDRVTQWPMEVVESQGLLKVDLLGLSTLTVMRIASQLIADRHGVKYTMSNIPYDWDHVGPDPSKPATALFDLLGRGETVGVFQIESAGMRKLMQQMRPTKLAHIVAALALYRPGPMEHIPTYLARMHGEEPIVYHHPALKSILDDTYGIIVYQEQVLQIAVELGGYTAGEADLMRRAISKKKSDEIARHKKLFVDGCIINGIEKEIGEKIYADIEFFANYGFNRAHATDYGKVCAQTAFLKAHYPIEYMTALLAVERLKPDKVSAYVAETKRMGYSIAPPHINNSYGGFTIEDDEDEQIIRFGLDAIKNVGVDVVEILVAEREANGPYRDLLDLARRVDLSKVRKKTLECMALVGAFDIWGNRSEMMGFIPPIVEYSKKHHANKSAGQMSLFGRSDTGETMQITIEQFRPLSLPVYTEKQILAEEKELLGMYLSQHPLDKWLIPLQEKGYLSATIEVCRELSHMSLVTIAVIVGGVKHHRTRKKQEAMAFVVFEDKTGSMDSVIFPQPWERLKTMVHNDAVLILDALVQVDESGERSLQVVDARPIEKWESGEKPLVNHLEVMRRETLPKLDRVSNGDASDNAPPPVVPNNRVSLGKTHEIFRVAPSQSFAQPTIFWPDVQNTAEMIVALPNTAYALTGIRQMAQEIFPNFPGTTSVIVRIANESFTMKLPGQIECSPEMLATIQQTPCLSGCQLFFDGTPLTQLQQREI